MILQKILIEYIIIYRFIYLFLCELLFLGGAMENIFSNKEDVIKNDINKAIIYTIIWSAFIVGISLVLIGLRVNIDIFYDLGLGLLSSALVSFIFMRVQFMIDNVKTNKKRVAFYESFYMHCFNIINDLPKISIKDHILSCEDYLIEVHRAFHEPYKKIIAKNVEDKEIKQLIKNIKKFVKSYDIEILFMFEMYKSNIDCFDYSEVDLLNAFFIQYKKLSNDKQYEDRILAMANFLTTLRRMISGIKNLKTLSLLKFQFESNMLNVIYDDFYKVEKFFEFAASFQSIRRKNIMEHYSKEKNT